jgi:hypothetical protein
MARFMHRELNDPKERSDNALNYAPAAEKSSWPTGVYVGAVVWAFLTLSIFTAALDGPETNAARGRAQIALVACALIRLAWALHKKDKSRGWIFYVVLLFLAAPIWMLIEHPLWSLGRALWGKGLNF